MAVTKTMRIDGKEVTFRASTVIPMLYRVKFHREISQTFLSGFFKSHRLRKNVEKGLRDLDPVLKRVNQLRNYFPVLRDKHLKMSHARRPRRRHGVIRCLYTDG